MLKIKKTLVNTTMKRCVSFALIALSMKLNNFGFILSNVTYFKQNDFKQKDKLSTQLHLFFLP